MALNELSLKASLNIDKTKEFENISSVIIDTIKTGRGSVINIVSNKEITSEDKIYLLQQENLKLLDALSELKDKIKKIENDFIYQEYIFHADKFDNYKGTNLEKKLLEKGVVDYKRRVDKQRHDYIYYYVSKKHWKTFINCIEEYEKEILNPNKESSNCKECLSLKDKNEKQIDNKINEMYQKYEVNSHFSFDNKASHLEKIALNKLLETKRKINSFLIKEYLCNVHNK